MPGSVTFNTTGQQFVRSLSCADVIAVATASDLNRINYGEWGRYKAKVAGCTHDPVQVGTKIIWTRPTGQNTYWSITKIQDSHYIAKFDAIPLNDMLFVIGIFFAFFIGVGQGKR